MSDSDGFLWVLAIGASIWAWSNHDKLQKERTERIDSVVKVDQLVGDLETRIVALERQVEFAEGDIKNAFAAQDRLRTVVNKNADIENREAVQEMTARGACGTETIRYPNGGWTVRNKECTVKDLRSP